MTSSCATKNIVFLDVKPCGLVDWFRAIFCPCRLGRRIRRVGEGRPDSEGPVVDGGELVDGTLCCSVTSFCW